jgi:hypothetical protein
MSPYPSSALAALAALLALAAPASASHSVPVGITDDRSEAVGAPAPAAAPSHVNRARARVPSALPPGRGVDLSLLGSLRLDPPDVGAHGDVAGYRSLAFVGKWRGPCPGTGVDIISLERPAVPRKLSDTADHANTSMEDMQAMRIGDRDVLATGLQDCRGPDLPSGTEGLELHDITDPAAPQLLSLLPTGEGVHELDLTRTPDGRALALLAVPSLEVATADADLRGGSGDLLIVDITDPRDPVQVAEWGVIDSGRFGLEFYLDVVQGADPRTYLHSVRANADGTRAYLSYWDAGVITLDISDPAAPRVLGRTGFEPGEEGNAHSVDEARGGDLLIQADEDYAPFETVFTSTALAGRRRLSEAPFGAPVAGLPRRTFAGEVVSVGRGCPAGAPTPDSPEDPYTGDPRGKVALIERGSCRFDFKVARAIQAGAVGVVIYNSEGNGDEGLVPAGERSVTLPDGSVVEIAIPVFGASRSVGLALAAGAAPVTIRAEADFNGWGFLRIWDNRNPSEPVLLSTFATPNTLSPSAPGLAEGRWYTAHNPEVVGDRMYVSWYADGVRVVDIRRPGAPRELGAWAGAGRPAGAPPVDIWSVVPHRGLLLASDRNHGLYVLVSDAG